jgi:hypothetical protein
VRIQLFCVYLSQNGKFGGISYRRVFLNRRAAPRYRALASVISGPRLIEKRIYRAAVSQRLRTSAIEDLVREDSQIRDCLPGRTLKLTIVTIHLLLLNCYVTSERCCVAIDFLHTRQKITLPSEVNTSLRSRKPKLTALRIRCADHATPSIRKSWH